jgi:hypothetical protein
MDVRERTEGSQCEGNNPVMPKAHEHWKVLPHGKLTEIDPNILTVIGKIHMPLTDLPRRMTVARLAGGRLVIFSAIALDEEGMRTIEHYGRPAFLVVPSDKHRLDARIWKDRYPALQVVAPEGSRKGVEDVVPVGTTSPQFEDSSVQFVTVPGTGQQEAALVVHTSNGATLVLNDLVGNIRNSTGFGGWFLRAMKFAGDAQQIPRPVRWTLIKDAPALRAQFLRWAEIPTLKRILVSHGEAIEYHPAATLRELARSLEEKQPDPATTTTA